MTEEKDTKVIEETLIKTGSKLAIGYQNGATLEQDFDVRPWTMDEDRELGDLRKNLNGANMAEYISIVLSYMLERVGTQKFTQKPDDQIAQRLIISNMWMPDVFAMYVWLRFRAMGRRLPMELTSPYTGEKFKWVGDLRSVPVRRVRSSEDTVWGYDLEVPINVRGVEITKFTMGPQKWSTLERVSDEPSSAQAKHATIHASIFELPELPKDKATPILEDEIRGLSKADIEGLAYEINERGLGPLMSLKPVCPKKNKPFEVPIDWTYDSFFGISSR